MITGSKRPEGCGVTHYSLRLAAALKARGVLCEIVSAQPWSVSVVPDLLRRIDSLDADVVHLQYPAAAYGYSIAPQCLSVFCPMFVTIHEATQARVLRRLSLYPFSVRSLRIVFTTPYERAYATRWAPWISSRSHVINLGCTIPIVPRPTETGDSSLLYFGLLRPRRGLEELLALAELFQRTGSQQRVSIIGAAPPRWSHYNQEIRARAAKLPVDWYINLPDPLVAELLARSEIAYLPFPDGASQRRTSLIAALSHGLAVVTTRGPQTPPELGDVVDFAGTPFEAMTIIERLQKDVDLRRRRSVSAMHYAARFSWDAIADEHITMYRAVLAEGEACRLRPSESPRKGRL
jgi:glycosyltransferase involved in cell wall biosynthesis